MSLFSRNIFAALIALNIVSGVSGLKFAHGGMRRQGCANLTNWGSYATVDIFIGTPPQNFSVIADTGSDDLIVPSCVCHDRGGCETSPRCFRGTNRSSTFSVPQPPGSVTISFGSGTVIATPASDVVQLGGIVAQMDRSVLLMTDSYLDVGGPPFEGLLGLGLPTPPNAEPGSSGLAADQLRDIIERILRPAESSEGNASLGPWGPSPDVPRGFIESAGAERFSLCLLEGPGGGALKLGIPPLQESLSSVKEMHWALDFHGASAGTSAPSFCQVGAGCKIIPDSGTTQIMGPAEQVSALLESICDAWPRCAANHTRLAEAEAAAEEAAEQVYGTNPFPLPNASSLKSQVVTWLLQDCDRWWGEAGGFQEVPSLHFHVAGADGHERDLDLPAWAWVIQYSPEETSNMTCQALIGSLGEMFPGDGPRWILGTPLFYQFVVQYDITTTPPSLAFRSEECLPCPDGGAMLQAGAGHGASRRTAHARPRPGPLGPLRMPTNIGPSPPKI